MVGCRAVVVALSTARELGLAAVAAAFILFAVVSAFLLPRRDPNFPGRRLPLFLGLTVAFFAAMIIETQAQTETAAGDSHAGDRGFDPSRAHPETLPRRCECLTLI